MSSQTPQFSGVGFDPATIPQILPFLATATTPTTDVLADLILDIAPGLTGTSNKIETANTLVSQFLNQFSTSNPMPGTLSGFTSSLVSFIEHSSFGSSFSDFFPGGISANQEMQNTIVGDVESAINIQPGGSDSSQLITVIGSQILNDPNLAQQIATNSFNNFLTTYPYPSANAAVQGSDFSQNFDQYYATVATVNSAYQLVFQAFFANSTNANGTTAFQQALASYVNNIITAAPGDYFLQSQDFSNWFSKIQKQYSIALSGAAAPTQTSDGATTDDVLILNKIFDLIVTIVGTLQSVTIAQSNRLNFLTSWQQAYTNLQGQIRTFVQGGPENPVLSGTASANANARDALNQANQTYTQEIQARRSVISDDSQSLQNVVNNSNDITNQQTSIATQIIQTFSTILSSIYR